MGGGDCNIPDAFLKKCEDKDGTSTIIEAVIFLSLSCLSTGNGQSWPVVRSFQGNPEVYYTKKPI